MDLRWRLVAYLSAFSLTLLVVASLVVGLSLHEDVAGEVAASSRLAELMLSVSEAREGHTEQLEHLLAGGDLRHLSVTLERSRMEQSSPSEPPGPLASWLPGLAMATLERRIPLGNETLVIRAEPSSEIREVLRDGGRILGTLLLFSLATIGVAWYAAHRALRPVRALEEGLARLGRGETQVAMPRFELKEFHRIATAIDRLAASLAQSRAAERHLARRLMDLQESERHELARELHDEFGQSLTAIGVAAAFVERHAGHAAPTALVECAQDIRGEAARVSEHVRSLLNRLRPHGLEGLGMVDAMGELIDGWRQRASGIAVHATLPEALPPLGEAAGLTLYRSLQEALTNVARHSGASKVNVTLSADKAGVRLKVADDGRGCAEHVHPGGGLLGMQERAAMAGGVVTLGNAPAGGLQVELWLPVSGTEHTEEPPAAFRGMRAAPAYREHAGEPVGGHRQ